MIVDALDERRRTTSRITLGPMQTAAVQIFVPDGGKWMAPYEWTVQAKDFDGIHRPLHLRGVKIGEHLQIPISDADPPSTYVDTSALDGRDPARVRVGWACFDNGSSGLWIALRNPWPFPMTAKVARVGAGHARG